MTTPQNYVPYDPTAVMGRRVVAALIDVSIAIALMIGLFVGLAESAVVPGDAVDFCDRYNDRETGSLCFGSGNDVFVVGDGDMLWVFAAPLIYMIANLVLLAGATGASLGKLIMGLRVVKQSDGSLHGFGAAALRWILWIVDGIPGGIFFPLVGLITSLASNGHRRVGDMAASTFVVDKSQVGVVPVVGGLPPTVAAGYAPPPPVGATMAPQSAPAQPPVAPPTAVAPPPPTEQFADPGESIPPEVEAEPSAPGVDAPTWDPQRNTYIQWDPALNTWMEWSNGAQQWITISQ